VVSDDEGVDENPDKKTKDKEYSKGVVEEHVPVVTISQG
jgi:hypothetical protein